MATKKQTASEWMENVSNRLCDLNSIITLCAFAAEARRTLEDIEKLKTISPDFEKSVSERIEASAEWTTHDDALGLVLKNVAHQMTKLQNQLDRAEA